MDNERLVYSMSEVARLLGMHENSIRKHIKTGAIATIRLGRRVLIPRYELERLGLLAKENPAMQGGAER